MRAGLALALVGVVAGCYAAPEPDSSCVILCTDSCPGDLTCKNGYCAAEGDTCAPTFEQIATGGGYACALDARHRLWCWGTNTRHQIDPTDEQRYLTATPIGTARWDAIATGGGHTCGIAGGALSCWGANDRGQVSGAILGDVAEPLAITASGATGAWTAVATGYQTTCAINDGALYCWGGGDRGVIGNGVVADAPLPVRVTTTLADWTDVSIGFGVDASKVPRTHACAISRSTGLWCWGTNDNGELGDGTGTASSVPIQVVLPSPPTSVAAAAYSTCATTSDLQVLCWGYNANGQIGDPLLVPIGGNIASPTPATLLSGWTHVVAAEQLICGLRGDEIWCWGTSTNGGMGNGVWNAQRLFSKVGSGATALSLAPNTNIDDAGTDTADLDLACALIAGEVRCWGTNQYGQLAQGAATLTAKPKRVVGDHHWTKLALGGSHACGVADGKFLCWGSTTVGQASGATSGTASVPCGSLPNLACDVSVPTPVSFVSNVTAFDLGANHVCALGDNLSCWGDNSFYQLGQSGAGPAANVIPGAWDGLFTTRGNGGCARQSGATHCWGAPYANAQVVGPVPDLDGFLAISTSTGVGSSYPQGVGCALDANQELSCYGGNMMGQFGNGDASTCCAGTCGNAACDGGETAATCPQDCSAGPLTRTGRRYRAISVGFGSTSSGAAVCAITTTDGGIECWGRNRNAVTGVVDGTTGMPPAYVYTATRVAKLSGCTQVSVGDSVACALCNGEVSCWGDHRRGAVGAGPVTATPISIPRKVEIDLDDDRPAEVGAGQGYACLRTEGGDLYCWGSNIHGALGTGVTGANLPTPIKF